MHYASLGILLGIASAASLAQVSPVPSGGLDLSAPSLRSHATLLQNNNLGVYDKLTDVLKRAEEKAAAKGISSSGLNIITNDPVQPGTPVQVIESYKKLACLADSIAIGHPNTWLYHLTESGASIYTDYDFVVETVLKDNRTSPLAAHVVLTRPGGSLKLGTGQLQTINAKPEIFPPLQTTMRYMLFLKYVPASGGYEAYGGNATLVASAGRWNVVRKALSNIALPEFALTVMEQNVLAWVSSCE